MDKEKQKIDYRNLSIAILLFIPVWIFFIAPNFFKIEKNFSYFAEVISTDNFYDESIQEFSGAEFSKTNFGYKVDSSDSKNILIKNTFDVRTTNNQPIFSVERLYGVDRKTGKHVDGLGDKNRNGYLFAPKNLKAGEPFTYWHINYDGPANMNYVDEQTIFGLKVFHYETDYEGVRIDQTENLSYLPDVGITKGVELEPHLEIWIEPKTGRLVKYKGKTTAYFYDLNTKERLNPWNQFTNTFSDDSTKAQVAKIIKEKKTVSSIEYVIPTLLFLAAIWFLVLRAVRFNKNKIINIVKIVSLFPVPVSLLVLYGWMAGNSLLISILPGQPGMNPLTAILFIFTSLGFYLYISGKNKVVRFITLLVMAVSFLRILDYYGILSSGIDLTFFKDDVLNFPKHARMAAYTSFSFMAMSVSLFSNTLKQKLFSFNIILPSLIAVVSLLNATSFLTGKINLLSIPEFFSSAFGVSILFFILSIALITLVDSKEMGKGYLFSNKLTFFFVMLIATVVSVVMSGIFLRATERELDTRFDNSISNIESMIVRRINVYVSSLTGAKGFFDSSNFVDREEWKKYIDTINLQKNYPGIQGIGFSEIVYPENKEAYEKTIQLQGFPDFHIKPVGERSIYTSIIYLEPFDERNMQAFGYDMYSESNRKGAMKKAIETGEPSVSDKITLVQEINEDVQAGFLIYLPVYNGSVTPDTIKERNDQIKGFVYAAFRAGDLIDNVVLKKDTLDVEFKIYDGLNTDKESLLYSSSTTNSSDLYKKNIIYILGKPWTIEFFGAEGSNLSGTEKVIPDLILLVGILLSFMLSITFQSFSLSRDKALVLAKELTKDLELEKNKDEAIISSVGEALVVTDIRGVISIVNKAFTQILGWTESEVVGKSIFDVIKIKDKEGKFVQKENRLILKILKYKEKHTVYSDNLFYYEKKDGTFIPVSITISAILNGEELVGAVQVFRDITKDYEIDKAKTEFVSLASHQLRTPLSYIGWYSEMLLDGDAGELNGDQRKYIEEIAKGNERMVDLVNALLNVSRIELGTFMVTPEDVDLVLLAKDALGELKQKIISQKLIVEEKYETNPFIYKADKKLTFIIFQNLISNAVKYTLEGGKVVISISHKDDNVLISVKDTGLGVPENQKDKIFSKMFRADNVMKTDTDGTGLGLYILKSIVEQNGGKIYFESKENVGTEFFIELPKDGMKPREGSRPLEKMKE